MKKFLTLVGLMAVICANGALSAPQPWNPPSFDVFDRSALRYATRSSQGIFGELGILGGSSAWMRVTADLGRAANTMQIDLPKTTGSGKEALMNASDEPIRMGVLAQMFGLRVGLAVMSTSFSDKRTPDNGVQLGGVDFASTSSVGTEIDLSYYRIDLGFGLPTLIPLIELGVGVGIHYIDMQVEATGVSPTGGATNKSKSFGLPLPTLSIFGGLMPIDSLSIEPQIMGMVLPEIAGFSGSIWDLSVMGKYYILPNIAIGARLGYFTLAIEGDKEDPDFSFSSVQYSAVVGISI